MTSNVSMEMVGKSAEGRELKVIKICRDGCGKKPIIFIEGGEKKRSNVVDVAEHVIAQLINQC